MAKKGKTMTKTEKIQRQLDVTRQLVADQLAIPSCRKMTVAAYEALAASNAHPTQKVVACFSIAISEARSFCTSDAQIREILDVMLEGSAPKKDN